MSTPTGQSDLQPLQDRHRSSDSATSSDCQPSVMISPFAISNSSRARPRVECFSSLVTFQLGHITPEPVSTAHLPTPRQRRVARWKLPRSWPKASFGSSGMVGMPSWTRRFSSIVAGRTTRPGFIRSSGSQIPLKSSKAVMICGGYIRGSSSARAWPSPCSPDSDPPCATTRSAAAIMKSRKFCTPGLVSRSKSIRTCRQPSPKWP